LRERGQRRSVTRPADAAAGGGPGKSRCRPSRRRKKGVLVVIGGGVSGPEIRGAGVDAGEGREKRKAGKPGPNVNPEPGFRVSAWGRRGRKTEDKGCTVKQSDG